MGAQALAAAPARPSVKIESKTIHDEELGIDVQLRTYRPTTADSSQAAILFIHGGGFVLGSVDQAQAKLSAWCEELGVFIVSVAYRLAPEFPFPAALHDCFAALKWLSDYAPSLEVNAERIAVVGESAGGGLAAGLALYARNHSDIKLALQVLIYPMLDHTNTAPASGENSDTYIWSRENNRVGWNAYLGDEVSADMLQYAAPSTAENLERLPPAYIPVGDLDLFLEENKEYARRLTAAPVESTLKIYQGGFHAFSSLAPDARISKQFDLDLLNAIRLGLSLTS
jgi:acetyl esterase/lipase